MVWRLSHITRSCRGPFVDVDEFRLRGVLCKIAQQQPAPPARSCPWMAPACDDRYSDLRPCTGWVRTSRCSTGLNSFFLLLAVVEEAERAPRIHQRVLADHDCRSRSWSRRRARHRPRACRRIRCCRPLWFTRRADSSENFAGIGRNELSECQRQLPRLNRWVRMVFRQRLAVLAEIGNVVEAGAERAVNPLSWYHVAAARTARVHRNSARRPSAGRPRCPGRGRSVRRMRSMPASTVDRLRAGVNGLRKSRPETSPTKCGCNLPNARSPWRLSDRKRLLLCWEKNYSPSVRCQRFAAHARRYARA